LISSGILDSFRLSWLIGALETRLGISIDPGEIGVDNLDTPRQILAFIRVQLKRTNGEGTTVEL
jgi:acyl carrier protein